MASYYNGKEAKIKVFDPDTFGITTSDEFIPRARTDFSSPELETGNFTEEQKANKRKQTTKDFAHIDLQNGGFKALDNISVAGTEVMQTLVDRANKGEGTLYIEKIGENTFKDDIGKENIFPIVRTTWTTKDGETYNVGELMFKSGLAYKKDKNNNYKAYGPLMDLVKSQKIDQAKQSFFDALNTVSSSGVMDISAGVEQLPKLNLYSTFYMKERLEDYKSHANKFVDVLANKIRNSDVIPGGRKILWAMEQNPEGYGLTKEEIAKDQTKALAIGLLTRVAAYSASMVGDESELTGIKSTKFGDANFNKNLDYLVNGSQDQFNMMVDMSVKFSPEDGTVRNIDRVTTLDKKFGKQIQYGSTNPIVNTFKSVFDGAVQSTVIGNTIQLVGSMGAGEVFDVELRREFLSDIYDPGSIASTAAGIGQIVGAVAGIGLEYKFGGSLMKGKLAQVKSGTNKFRYLAHGGLVPAMQSWNESASSPLYESSNPFSSDKNMKDIGKSIADGLQNMATMWVGDKYLESILTGVITKRGIDNFLGIGGLRNANKMPSLSNSPSILSKFIDKGISNSMWMGAKWTTADLVGNAALDYATVTGLNYALKEMDIVEESIFTNTTTRMFQDVTTSGVARILANRFGARFARSIISNARTGIMSKFGLVDPDKEVGTADWYTEQTDVKLGKVQKMGLKLGNMMFGNVMKDLDSSFRQQRGESLFGTIGKFSGEIDRIIASDMDDVSKNKAIAENASSFSDITLLRWMAHKGALTSITKNAYGWIMKGTDYEDIGKEDIGRVLRKLTVESNDMETIGTLNEFSEVTQILRLAESGLILSKNSVESLSKSLFTSQQLEDFAKLSPDEMHITFLTILRNVGKNGDVAKRLLSQMKKAVTELPSGTEDEKKLIEEKLKVFTQKFEPDQKINWKEQLRTGLEALGMESSKAITPEMSKEVMDGLKSVLSPADTDIIWKLSMGYSFHSKEMQTALNGLRTAFKGLLANNLDNVKIVAQMSHEYPKLVKNASKIALENFKNELNSISKKEVKSNTENQRISLLTDSALALARLNSGDAEIMNTVKSIFKMHSVKLALRNNDIGVELKKTLTKEKGISDDELDSYIAQHYIGRILAESEIGQLGAFDVINGRRATDEYIISDVVENDPIKRNAAIRKLRLDGDWVQFEGDKIKFNDLESKIASLSNITQLIQHYTEGKYSNVDDLKSVLASIAIRKAEYGNIGKTNYTQEVEVLSGNKESTKLKAIVTYIESGEDREYTVKIDKEDVELSKFTQDAWTTYIGMASNGVNKLDMAKILKWKLPDAIGTGSKTKTVESWMDDVEDFYGISKVNSLDLASKLVSIGYDTDDIVKTVVEYITPPLRRDLNNADIELVAKSIVVRSMSMAGNEITVGMNREGGINKVSITPVTVSKGLVNYRNAEFGATAISLEFPEGTPEDIVAKETKKFIGVHGMLTTGPAGNNLKYNILVTSMDIHKPDGFAVFQKNIPGIIESLNTSSGERDRLIEAFNSITEDNLASFTKKALKQVSEGLKETIVKEVGIDKLETAKRIQKTIKETKKSSFSKLIEDSKDLKNRLDNKVKNDLSNYITRFKNILQDISNTANDKTISNNALNSIRNIEAFSKSNIDMLDKNFKNLEIKDIGDISTLKEYDKAVSSFIVNIKNEINNIKDYYNKSFKDLGLKFDKLSDIETLTKDLEDVPVEIEKLLNELSRDRGYVFNELNKDGIDAKTFVALRNIEMIDNNLSKISDLSDTQGSEFLMRLLSQGEGAILTDYAEKRGAFAITSPLSLEDKKLLLSDDPNNKTTIIMVGADALDGATILPKRVLTGLSLQGAYAGGKFSHAQGKSMADADTNLDEKQILSLLGLEALKITKDRYISKLKNAGIANPTNDQMALAIKKDIEDGVQSFMILTPESMKGVGVDILGVMKDNGYIFDGNVNVLKTSDSIVDPLLRIASHTYLKNKTDTKELSTQLISSELYDLIDLLALNNIDKKANKVYKGKTLTEILSDPDSTVRSIFKKLSTSTEAIGSTEVARGWNLGASDYTISTEDNRGKSPWMIFGSRSLGEAVLESVNKEDSEVRALAAKFMNDESMTDDEFKRDSKKLVEYLEKSDIGYFAKEGENYYVNAIRYPAVGGSNHIVSKISGVKKGAYGSSFHRTWYSKYMDGDWDGDMVQLIQLPTGVLETYGGIDKINRKLEDRYLIKSMNTIGGAGIKGNSIIDSSANIGSLMSNIQNTLQYVTPMNSVINNKKGFESFGIENSVSGISILDKEVVYTASISTDAAGKKLEQRDQSAFEKINEDTHGYGSTGSMVIFDKSGSKSLSAIGSLGDGTDKDVDNKLVQSAVIDNGDGTGAWRLFRKGSLNIIALESQEIPGAFEIKSAHTKSDYSNTAFQQEVKNIIDRKIDNDKQVFWMKNKYMGSLVGIDLFTNLHGTSRVKIGAISIIKNSLLYNEDNLLKLYAGAFNPMRMKNGTLTLRGRDLAESSFIVDAAKKLSDVFYNKIIDNGEFSYDEWKSAMKWTKGKLPTNDMEVDAMYASLLKLAGDNTKDKYLNSALKSIVIPLRKQLSQYSGDMNTKITKEFGAYLAKDLSIDIYTTEGRKLLRAAMAFKEFTEISGIVSGENFVADYFKHAPKLKTLFNYGKDELLSIIARKSNDQNASVVKNTTKITDKDVENLLIDKLGYFIAATNKPIIAQDLQTLGIRLMENRNTQSDLESQQGISSLWHNPNEKREEVSVMSFMAKANNLLIEIESDSSIEANKTRIILNSIVGTFDTQGQRIARHVVSGLSHDFIKAVGTKEGKLTIEAANSFNGNIKRLWDITEWDPHAMISNQRIYCEG